MFVERVGGREGGRERERAIETRDRSMESERLCIFLFRVCMSSFCCLYVSHLMTKLSVSRGCVGVSFRQLLHYFFYCVWHPCR